MVVVVAVVFAHHIPQPKGELSVTTNGHTYYGDPPALTLYQSDPASAVIIVIVISAGVLVSFVDLLVRTRTRRTGPGTVSVAVGGVVVLFSLFGLLWGLTSIGVIGLLLVLSGLAGRDTTILDAV